MDENNFEKSLAELEETVKKLESDGVTLDEAMALFEKGVTLAKECAKKLDEAELKVKKLVGGEAVDMEAVSE